MANIADIHCHIIPYVDDGAIDKDISDELISRQAEQGVTVICCTPHLRRDMFETPDDTIREQFRRLQERVMTAGTDVELYLSREYHADKLLLKTLESGKILPLGTDHLLLEMSNGASEREMKEYIETVQSYGYKPLLAHPERYHVIREYPETAERMVQLGAKLQLNAGSILGREGLKQKNLCRKLLKKKLIYAVASDAHDPEDRPPELDKVYELLTRKCGANYTEQLMYSNPLKILKG